MAVATLPGRGRGPAPTMFAGWGGAKGEDVQNREARDAGQRPTISLSPDKWPKWSPLSSAFY